MSNTRHFTRLVTPHPAPQSGHTLAGDGHSAGDYSHIDAHMRGRGFPAPSVPKTD